MSKERKLVDLDDMYTGPMSDTKDNNRDTNVTSPKVPGHGQGGEGHGPSATAEGGNYTSKSRGGAKYN